MPLTMLLEISHAGWGWGAGFFSPLWQAAHLEAARRVRGFSSGATTPQHPACLSPPRPRHGRTPPHRRGDPRAEGEPGEACRRGRLPYLDEASAVQGGVHAARHLPSEHHRAVPVAQPPAPPQAVHLRAARGRDAGPARGRHQQQQQQRSSAHGGARPPPTQTTWPPAGASGRLRWSGGHAPAPPHRHGPLRRSCGTTDRRMTDRRGGNGRRITGPLRAPATRPRPQRAEGGASYR